MRLTLALTLFLTGCSKPSSVVEWPATRQAEPKESGRPSDDWAGLRVQFAGTPLEGARQAVVLMHGYGAPGDDLLSLAQHIGGESRAFVFPEGPISLPGGGKAWATTDEEFDLSCQRVIKLIDEIAKKYPEVRISVGGFSQGATISSKLLIEERLKLEHAFLYSSSMKLDKDIPQAKFPTHVLIAHGREDVKATFSEAERLKDLLIANGYNVNWLPFDGGHTLTRELIVATRKQLDEITN